MVLRKLTIALVVIFVLLPAGPVKAELPRQQLYALFGQANEAFRQANSMPGDPRAEKLYEKAILSYERIISEGRVRNGRLYYNLANAYFLRENIGKAILNYRRAEQLDGSDANIRKNLEFARSRRIDKITPRAEKRVLETLFFWHYDFSLRARFLLTCVFFAALCTCLIVMVWLGRGAPAIAAAVIAGVLMLCLLISVVVESRHRAGTVCGVITAGQVVARQGDGQNYAASFKDPLHAGTEFDLIEHRPGWFHIRLSDSSDGWIRDDAAELI